MKFATTLAVLLMPLVAIAQKKSVRLAVAEFWRNSTAIDQVSSGDLSAVRSTLQMLLEDNFLGTVQEMKELKIAQFPVAAPSAGARTAKSTTGNLPVVQMHGMGDFANDPFGMIPLAKSISSYLGGVYVLNVQIGQNSLADILNGFFMNLDDQVDYFAKVVKADAQLVSGFNAVGYSQGNLVIRGYIERYNTPPVLNFISMHGPLAGVAGFPGCSLDKALCQAFAEVLGALAYHPKVQDGLAQANYFRDPFKLPQYIAGARFLPDVNNEDDSAQSSYTARFTSLQSLTLVKALGDTVVIPNESEWFGGFAESSFETVLPYSSTSWYTQDLFGLKTLDSRGAVFFNTTNGDHLDFETDFLLDLVGQHFVA